MRKSHQPILLIALGLALLTGAWVLYSRDNDSPEEVTVTQAPDFTLATIDGNTFTLSDLRGKVVLINFWASWCGPCEREAEDLQAAWDRYRLGGEVVFLGINDILGDTETDAYAFIGRHGITFPNGFDWGAEIGEKFHVSALPLSYIIDRTGRITHIQAGAFSSVEQITSLIDPYLTAR